MDMRIDKFSSKLEDIEFEIKSRYERINDNVIVIGRNNEDVINKYHDMKAFLDKNMQSD